MARGSWLLSNGIANRWDENKIDDFIRQYWPADSEGFQPLQRGEQRPETPHPYVVFMDTPGIVEGHSSGITNENEEIQYQLVPVAFHIHAKDHEGETADDVAVAVATKIKEAFDVDNEPLDIAPDCHIETYADPDIPIREGDEEYQLVVQYRFRIDATFATRPPTG